MMVKADWNFCFPGASPSALVYSEHSSLSYRNKLGKVVPVEDSSVVFFPHGLPCDLSGKTHQESPARLLCGVIALNFGTEAWQLKLLPECLTLPANATQKYHALLDEALRLDSCSNSSSTYLLHRTLEVLVVALVRAWLAELADFQLAGLGAMKDPSLARVIQAIHLEPWANWTLPALADIAFLSRAAFAARFRTTVGLTPLEYVRQCRAHCPD